MFKYAMQKHWKPFNTTIIPSPPALSPSPSSFAPRPPEIGPGIQVFGQPPPEPSPHSPGKPNSFLKNKVVWVAIGGFLILIVLASGLCICISRCRKEKSTVKVSKREPVNVFKPSENRENLTGSKDPLTRSREKIETVSKRNEDHTIDMPKVGAADRGPAVDPRPVLRKTVNSARFFSIASLQEYTDSFSQENLVGRGSLATVYRAELPNGKQLAIKKLDDTTSRKWSDERFMELVMSVSKLRNENVVGLEGYCVGHGQRLFVYEYCENGTLHEALHLNDEMHERLSWNSRVHVALHVARALEYLHEVCQPPVVHQNVKSTNVLFDDELNARVSDCGLAPLLPLSYASQLQGSGYGAPELESGSYTYQSDVYSFGVIMLELFTGRKAFDRSSSFLNLVFERVFFFS
ncbi:hypothetical protein OSB04_002067 [Centaurea solstitialis]|uniref:Protein kinase domain-containing protein n=1 Tax=Centaurea solstitialis TaxID=347529 RepID=A0AA38U4T4_9ASTR|nr:hypothetical protein OSB04_002067 [Centaurea solstitialis]